MKTTVNIDKNGFTAVNTAIRNEIIDGEKTLVVVKANKLLEFDENTYARLNGVILEDCIIEVKMLSRLLPDAPDYARGFIGIAFGINEDDSRFDSFYVQPTNSVTVINDPVRNSHGCQYFSYPGYTFQYFRDHSISIYENSVSCELNKWMELKAEIKGNTGRFYLDGNLILTVDEFISASHKGYMGFFVDIGTEAFYKDLVITAL